MSLLTNKYRRKYSKKSLLELAILLVLVVIFVGGLIRSQVIIDWIRLRGYKPPTAVTQLADQDTMTSYTRHIFYLNRPDLLSSVTSFRKYCPENNDDDVLGCYHSGENGIYIYNVQDPTLQGVAQVTAAHEVLHGVYERLSGKARTQLDSELEAYYKHGLTDPIVKAEVTVYQQTEPTDVYDEMSCTFGTEVAQLPAALNAYYAHYFSNRSAIVEYEQKYETQFSTRESMINSDDQNLSLLKQTIDSEQSTLTTQLVQITAEQTKLTSERSSDISSYNSAVPVYNGEVNVYNSLVQKMQANIASYNAQVVARNATAGVLTTLDKALDTRLTTQATK